MYDLNKEQPDFRNALTLLIVDCGMISDGNIRPEVLAEYMIDAMVAAHRCVRQNREVVDAPTT